MSRAFLKLAHGFVSIATAFALLIAGLYSGYCLWDNQQIYAAARDVQEELLIYKPKFELETLVEEARPTFDELLAINPDICGWVTMDNTQIDYAVVQGESNLTYINTDIYGNFALAGSIFLDSRNDRAYADPYSLLYGHHMENSGMFGDLDLYLDEKFFHENRTGLLILPEGVFSLRVLACMQTSASDNNIFDPTTWAQGASGLIDYARAAQNIHEDEITDVARRLESADPPRILALTTCSSDYTDARTVVLTVMNPIGQGRK